MTDLPPTAALFQQIERAANGGSLAFEAWVGKQPRYVKIALGRMVEKYRLIAKDKDKAG